MKHKIKLKYSYKIRIKIGCPYFNLPDKLVAHTSIWLSSADVAEAAVAPNISPAVARETPIFAPGGICLINSSGISFYKSKDNFRFYSNE